jgi:hypothetical protein
VLTAAGPAMTAAADAAAEAAGAPPSSSSLPATPAEQEPAMQAGATAGSKVKPFPAVEHVPGAGVSQTFLTSQLHELAATNRVFKRSVMDAAAASARIVCVDFQHEPTKYVHANGGRSFTAIFNLIDITTGGQHACGDVTDAEGVRCSLRPTSNGGGLLPCHCKDVRAACVLCCRCFCVQLVDKQHLCRGADTHAAAGAQAQGLGWTCKYDTY